MFDIHGLGCAPETTQDGMFDLTAASFGLLDAIRHGHGALIIWFSCCFVALLCCYVVVVVVVVVVVLLYCCLLSLVLQWLSCSSEVGFACLLALAVDGIIAHTWAAMIFGTKGTWLVAGILHQVLLFV
jgi:hypothetical protein